jgi:hypothetical protein
MHVEAPALCRRSLRPGSSGLDSAGEGTHGCAEGRFGGLGAGLLKQRRPIGVTDRVRGALASMIRLVASLGGSPLWWKWTLFWLCWACLAALGLWIAASSATR